MNNLVESEAQIVHQDTEAFLAMFERNNESIQN